MTALVAWLTCDKRDRQTVSVSARRARLLAAAPHPFQHMQITLQHELQLLLSHNGRRRPTCLICSLPTQLPRWSSWRRRRRQLHGWPARLEVGCECSPHAGVMARSTEMCGLRILKFDPHQSTEFEQWSTSAVHSNLQSWVCS